MQYLIFYVLPDNIKQVLKDCNRCFRKLTPIGTVLFNDDDNAICRDCWINQNFEPITQSSRR